MVGCARRSTISVPLNNVGALERPDYRLSLSLCGLHGFARFLTMAWSCTETDALLFGATFLPRIVGLQSPVTPLYQTS